MTHPLNYSMKYRKLILIVWASAIMWIYLGNIINFHQHHIWGKQLIPIAATSNRSKEKTFLKINSTDSSFLHPVKEVFHVDLLTGTCDLLKPMNGSWLLVLPVLSFHPLSVSLEGLSLRAPPAC